MAKLTKRQKAIAGKIEAGKSYNFVDAAALLTELSTVKFSESVDVAVNLGVDPRKSDQVVRSATVLPHGTGKTVRVAVFTQGPAAEAALAAGADRVGGHVVGAGDGEGAEATRGCAAHRAGEAHVAAARDPRDDAPSGVAVQGRAVGGVDVDGAERPGDDQPVPEVRDGVDPRGGGDRLQDSQV